VKQIIRLQVNGETHEIAVEPHKTLLNVLREDLELLGAKRGCDSGGCGACTVLIDGDAVYSCMVFAATAQDKQITTIEGLKHDDTLDPLQQSFISAGAVQCGYCSCGMILAAKEFLRDHPSPTDEEIRHGISGNLCRCTGYQKIVDAIRLASAAR
jgi:carbon-monoxide dehydrogenase small subunit